MGNCLWCNKSSSSMVWVGDDWETEPVEAERSSRHKQRLEAEKVALISSSSTPSASSVSEVKIKITKKQLEELLGRAEVQGMPPEQILCSLIDSAHRSDGQNHQPWRPTLQSIPEVD